MRTLYCVSVITILGSTAIPGCEVGGDAWPSSRGSGDGGAAPQVSTTNTVASSATTIAATSTGAGSSAMTTATGGEPIPVPAADE